MISEFLHIVITASFMWIINGILSNDSKNVCERDLLMSKIDVSSDFICHSNENDTSIIWERHPGGQLIYSIDRVNPDSQDRFVMNKSSTPSLILTLVKPRLSDAGEYQCKQELTEIYLKHLTHIVFEFEPVGDMHQDETNKSVNAWCSMTYAGNNDSHTVTWYSQNQENITTLNTSKSSIFYETRYNTTMINSTVSVTNLAEGSYLICQFQFELFNYSNSSKFTFNWTSSAVSQQYYVGSTEEHTLPTASLSLTSSHPDFSASNGQTSQRFISSEYDSYTSATEYKATLVNEGSTTTTGTNLHVLIVGMTVTFVAIVIVLIVVIICMYAYVRSKTAATNKKRAESSYAMPLPSELPRSTSYEKIEPIYNEPNANRGSIISSNSYNYPDRFHAEIAPKLPERYMANNLSPVGMNYPNWKNAETSFDSDAATQKLTDPGDYLEMPNDSLHRNKDENSDDFCYTLVPENCEPDKISLNEKPSPLIVVEKRFEKSIDGYENSHPNIYEEAIRRQETTERERHTIPLSMH